MKIILREIDNKELTTVNKFIWRNNIYDKYQEISNNQELKKKSMKKNIFLLIINKLINKSIFYTQNLTKKLIFKKYSECKNMKK